MFSLTQVGGLNWLILGIRLLAIEGWPGAMRICNKVSAAASEGEVTLVGLPDVLEWAGPWLQILVYLAIGISSVGMLGASLTGWWIRRGGKPIIGCASEAQDVI